jgi:septal ring-binding cell division protein DamX
MRFFVSISIKILILTLLLMGFIQSSHAQSESTPSAKAARKQTLNFEDELVKGDAQKPDLFYLFQRKDMNQGRLIKLRQNFLPEMRKTTEDIQRVRGGR